MQIFYYFFLLVLFYNKIFIYNLFIKNCSIFHIFSLKTILLKSPKALYIKAFRIHLVYNTDIQHVNIFTEFCFNFILIQTLKYVV